MYEVCIRLSYGVYTRHFSLLCMHVMHCIQYDNTSDNTTSSAKRCKRIERYELAFLIER